MNGGISSARMEAFSARVSERLGLHFPPERWRDLHRGLEAVAGELGFAKPDDCLEHLVSSPWTQRETDHLARALTIGETYFFRDPKIFELIRTELLPPLLAARRGGERRLRLWSAGCSSGEEAYSLAILLDQCLAGDSSWEISILATDINPAFLKKAREGLYTRWSFRGNHPWLERGYFLPAENGRLQVVEKIREMVEFFPLNLAEDAYPSLLNNTNAMDLILCRNVLMYFHPTQVANIVENFRRALVDGGWLIVSACETFKVLNERFECVSFPDAFFYRKERRLAPRADQGEAVPPRPEPAAPALPARPAPGAGRRGKPAAAKGAASPQGRPMPPLAPPPEAQPALEKAAGLYRRGRYEEAAGLARALLQDAPEPAAMALLVRILANQGKLAAASDWCQQLLQLEKLDPEYHYLQGTILLEQGDLEQAAGALERALYLDGDFILGHFTLAHLWEKLGKLSRARKHLENTRRLLQNRPATELLPGSDGLTSGRLLETVNLMGKGGLDDG